MENLKLLLPARVKKILLVTYDVIMIQLASLAALWLRFEFDFSAIPGAYIHSFVYYAAANTALTLALFYCFKLYSSLWVFAGSAELINMMIASGLSGVGIAVGNGLLRLSMPKSFYVLYVVFLFAGAAGIRVFYRLLRHIHRHAYFGGDEKKIMLIGAGEAGSIILKEIMDSNHISGRVVCCIDDSPEKKGKYICGVKIEGGRARIPEIAEVYDIDEIIVAIPSAPAKSVSGILENCKLTGCKIRILPGIYQFINGETCIPKLRDVEIEDLLGRDPIQINLEEIMDYVTGKTILVTGGGGSIGSELCRQIAGYNPKQLIIIDVYENGAFEIQQELLRTYPGLSLGVLIASVRDAKRMDEIFETYRPDIVCHAAAHKHVPLMEDSPNEAIKNNVFGTLNVAKAAGEFGVKRFVLISTDKAVNPTNIMGASKRMCEMIIQTMNGLYDTEFVAVRFGNVLGSNGSVIPLFKKQIAAGGPVTVTHKDIIRYFMTISEAVSLVLQAGAYAKGGEIFILDMGEPVRIDDLARNLIRLSGYVPDVDIDVVYTGLRPGEKLFEEMLMSEEGLQMTDNRLIFVARPIVINESMFVRELKEIQRLAENNDEDIRHKVREIVDTYKLDKTDSGYVIQEEAV